MSTVTEQESPETTEVKTNKWVYLFDEGPGDDKTLLGGKGAGLCEMTQAGLPVPPGLVVTTKPGGTGKPAWVISQRPAPLPPSSVLSSPGPSSKR